jgi:PAS domain S-box-containing protein
MEGRDEVLGLGRKNQSAADAGLTKAPDTAGRHRHRFPNDRWPVWLALGCGVLYWITESFLNSYFSKSGSVTWLAFLPPSHEIWERLFVLFILACFTILTRYLIGIRRQVERSLTQREDLYRTLVENLHQSVFLKDTDLRFVSANRSLCAPLGLSPEQIVGRTDFDFYPPDLAAKYQTDDRKVLQTGAGIAVREEHQSDQGRKWVEVVKTPVRNAGGTIVGVLGIFWDITERHLTDERLQLTQFAIDHASDAVFWIDDQGGFLYANDAACRDLGYSREEMTGMTLADVAPRSAMPQGAENWKSITSNGSTTFETEHRRKDGTLYPVEVTISHARFNGRQYHFAFARDFTERKRAEAERHRLETQIQHAQKLESLGVLAGGIAHDFNNLLTSIMGNASLALMDLPEDSPARECIEQIEVTSQQAAELTNQMLAYSGKGRFVVKQINLSHLVEEMMHLLQTVISPKTTLQYALCPDLPSVGADASQIRQVVLSLITNASEAIGETSGVVTVETGTLLADRAYLHGGYPNVDLPAGRYAFVEVRDSGCGMDAKTKASIFEPFFTTKFTGRGLGLAAALGIVRGHGGTIQVTSEPGEGATFRVLFPSSEQPLETPAAPCERIEPWRGHGTILVVDDEPPVRNVARMMLERIGFKVMTVERGAEAVDVFRKSSEQIVAVILDLTMPDMDGHEVFRKLRQTAPDVRVILSSGFSEHEATARFVGDGLAGFVQKPYRFDVLAEKVREAIHSDNG